MKKIIRNTVIVLYAIIAITVTICLLSYNKYRITEFGDYSLIIIDNDELSPEFKKGDLVIVDGSKKPKVGDKIFFYNTHKKDISVSIAEIIEEEVFIEEETTYILEGEKVMSREYIIGKTDGVIKIGLLGTILGILESKWGFLILIVFPLLFAFLYEIAEIITELRNSKKQKDENSQKKEDNEK